MKSGKSHLSGNDERSFCKGFEELSASCGYGHLSHAYRENFNFRDRQFMTYAMNNPWLYNHQDSWRQRRFSADSDRNTYPYMYERNSLIDRRYETNSLRPADFSGAFGNMQFEKGGMDLNKERRALLFTAEAKEQSEMRRLMKPMKSLKAQRGEGNIGKAVGNAYEAFSETPGRKLRDGSYDTSFSETHTSAYELKAGLVKSGDDEEIVSGGKALAGKAGKWEYIPEDEEKGFFDEDEERKEKETEQYGIEHRREENGGASLFETVFSMSPMIGQETEEDIYKQKRREKEEDERRIKKLVAGREKLAAYTLMKSSINLGMDMQSRTRINSYHDVMGSQREEYHSGLDPRGEFKNYDKKKLESLAQNAKNISPQFLTGQSSRIGQDTENEQTGIGGGLFDTFADLTGGLFTDFEEMTDEQLQGLARDSEMLSRPAVRERVKKSNFAINEYAKYLPDSKKHLVNRIEDQNEIKKRAVAAYCNAKKSRTEFIGSNFLMDLLAELSGSEGEPQDMGGKPEDSPGPDSPWDFLF